MDVITNQHIGAPPSEYATVIQNAGIDGAGGAGFPAYAKWKRLDEVDYLMVNHQESEPNYYIDKWLGREYATEFAAFFDTLLEADIFDVVVIGAKERDREEWMGAFEAATSATVRTPDDLPLDLDRESGVVVAYTDDRYEYGMESVLLRLVASVVLRNELPMDHGWIVQNTETLYNVYRALGRGTPVTHKWVHVDGNVPRHRFLHAPVGTPATVLLEATGVAISDLDDDQLLADGGPGWCFAVEESPEEFGLRKRTNGLLVLDRAVAEQSVLGDERINVLDEYDWYSGSHETEPTAITPEYVRVPLVSNPSLEGIVSPSVPTVAIGDRVSEGDVIATPGGQGFSTPQHASIDGEVTAVTETHVEIRETGEQGG